MKKSSIAIVVSVIIVFLSGVIYINNSINRSNNADNLLKSQGGQQNGDNSQSQQSSSNITFGEYACKISDNDSITVKYIKTGQTVKIYSLYPVANTDSYDISQNGSSALYLGKDGHIWILYSNGTFKKITPDKYGDIDKGTILKKNPKYIWAGKPIFTPEGNVRFMSNLPDTGGSPKETIWEINVQNGSMGEIYTPVTTDFKSLGTRDDGKSMILDGNNIAVIENGGTAVQSPNSTPAFENMDVKGKNILNLSADGKKIIFANRDANNKTDFRYLYVMDSYGKDITRLPAIEGYSATGISAWSDDSSKFAYITKSQYGLKDEIAVITFDDGIMGISKYAPNDSIVFTDNCKLYWIENGAISIDTGSDVVNIDIG